MSRQTHPHRPINPNQAKRPRSDFNLPNYTIWNNMEQSDDTSLRININSIEDKLNKVSSIPPHWSIFRVPGRLRNVTLDSYKLYTPQLVAIGPAHSPAHLRQKGFHFQAMEEHKLIYMKSLLDRTGDSKALLTKCAEAISDMEAQARAFYADPSDREHAKLSEIMLVDGCFILELFIKHHKGDHRGPIFSNAWMALTLKRDLSLLENQIPFPILHRLLQEIRPHLPPDLLQENSLVDLALEFFSSAWNLKEEEYEGIIDCKHFLDLLLNCYLPKSARDKQLDITPADDTRSKNKTRSRSNFISSISKSCIRLCKLTSNSESGRSEPQKTDWEKLHTALELSAAGIEFKKSKSSNMFDVDFTDGVLRIPQFRIDDLTETVLKNLIAYEQCCAGSTHHITSYVLFMDRLINSWQDVRFLEKKQILTHLQGNSGHVSKLFNNICKEVVLKDDFIFGDVCDKVHRRYESAWRKRLAVLKRDYFPNLWKVLAFLAAFILLALTALQTAFSIASYYQQ